MSLNKSVRLQTVTPEFKRKLFRDLLLEKQLKFADCVQDEEHDKAKDLFKDPFLEEAAKDQMAARDETAGTDLEGKKSNGVDLGDGGMADVNLIRTLTNEPVFASAQLNKTLEKVLARKGRDEDALILKFRMYMLVSTDDEERNVLHIACRSGSPLIYYIVEEARKMGVLDCIINAEDELGQTPLYLLCSKGAGKKVKNPGTVCRLDYIKLLVHGPQIDAGKGLKIGADESERAKWLFRVSQVKYSPLHWLAYWNDYKSVGFLLDCVE